MINIFNWNIFKTEKVHKPSTTLERVEKVITEKLGVPDDVVLCLDTERHDLWMDSLDDVELLMFIEEEFDIDISDEKWETCYSIRDMVILVEEVIHASNS